MGRRGGGGTLGAEGGEHGLVEGLLGDGLHCSDGPAAEVGGQEGGGHPDHRRTDAPAGKGGGGGADST